MKSAAIVVAFTAGLVGAASCLVDRRSSDYACDSDDDCKAFPDHRVCDEAAGFCVPEDCPAACNAGCDNTAKTCDVMCASAGSCDTVDCPDGYTCTINCVSNNACGDIDCSDAAACTITCNGNHACGDVDCNGGSNSPACMVTCNGNNACGDVRSNGRFGVGCTGFNGCGDIDCADSCACTAVCNGGNTCGTVTCPAGCTQGAGCGGCDTCSN